MPKLTNTRNNRQPTDEIKGFCALMWGVALIPAVGTVTVKIDGNNLRTTVKSGLEKKESWTRIKNIDSIEIHSAPNSLLLTIGISIGGFGVLAFFASLSSENSPIVALFFCLLGGGIIWFAMTKKQRYVAIYSLRYAIFLFMDGPPEKYQQFATQVMAIADQANQAKENEPSGITNEPFSMAPE